MSSNKICAIDIATMYIRRAKLSLEGQRLNQMEMSHFGRELLSLVGVLKDCAPPDAPELKVLEGGKVE